MASFYEAIREFSALTRRREGAMLVSLDEARFQQLLAFFESVQGDEEPPEPATSAPAEALIVEAAEPEPIVEPIIEPIAAPVAELVAEPVAESPFEAALAAPAPLVVEPTFVEPEEIAPPVVEPSVVEPAAIVPLPPAAEPEGEPLLHAPQSAIDAELAALAEAAFEDAPIDVSLSDEEPAPVVEAAPLVEAVAASESAPSTSAEFVIDVDATADLVTPGEEPEPAFETTARIEVARSETPLISLVPAPAPVEEPEHLESTPPMPPELLAAARLESGVIVAPSEPIEVVDDVSQQDAGQAIDIDVDESSPDELITISEHEAPAIEAAPEPVLEAASIVAEPLVSEPIAAVAAEPAPAEEPLAAAWLEAPVDAPPPEEPLSVDVALSETEEEIALSDAPLDVDLSVPEPEAQPVPEFAALDLSAPSAELDATADALLAAPAEEPALAEAPALETPAIEAEAIAPEAPALAQSADELLPEEPAFAEPVLAPVADEADASHLLTPMADDGAATWDSAPIDVTPIEEAPLEEAPVAASDEVVLSGELDVPMAAAEEESLPESAPSAAALGIAAPVRTAEEATSASTMRLDASEVAKLVAQAAEHQQQMPAAPELDDDELLAFATGEASEPGLPRQVANALASQPIEAWAEPAAAWAAAPAEEIPELPPIEDAAEAPIEVPAYEEGAPEIMPIAATVSGEDWHDQPAASGGWDDPMPPVEAAWEAAAAPENWADSAPQPAADDQWSDPAALPADDWSAAAAEASAQPWDLPAQQPAAAEAWDMQPPEAAPAEDWNALPQADWSTPAEEQPAAAWGDPAPTPVWNQPVPVPGWAAPAAPQPAESWNAQAATTAPKWQEPPPIATASEFLADAASQESWAAPPTQSAPAPSWNAPAAPQPAWAETPTWRPAAVTEPALRAVAPPSSASGTILGAPAVGAPMPAVPALDAWADAGSTAAWAPVVPQVQAGRPVIPGEHRVVLHTLEGGVKRGIVADLDLDADYIGLAQTPGALPSETVPMTRAKAIFFMLQPGERPPVGTGRRAKVTFVDGRQVEGVLGEESGRGFFLLPIDGRTNTARVFVLSHAVRQVS